MGNPTTADLLRIVGAREVDWLADGWIGRGFRDPMAPDRRLRVRTLLSKLQTSPNLGPR
jgi:hypothetical protein